MSGVEPSPHAPAPCVTVTVPLYNSASTIERCLRSAMRQTLADIEILVADDGSSDDGAAIAERLARDDGRIRVLRLWPNGGKPAAMNRMVAEARGAWVAVLDADDAFADDRLRRLIAAAGAHDAEMAADNIVYVDAGADRAVRTAFDPAAPDRAIGREAFLRASDPHGAFDFGILKPVIRRDFLLRHGLTYYDTRLSEDFYYLMNVFLAGGRGVLVSEPGYFWTMPFGAISRAWTGTGSGAWRYDYRQALIANEHFVAELEHRDPQTAAMLRRRSAQYRVMIHYLDAQRAAASGARVRALGTIARHPRTWPLLARRVVGRMGQKLRAAPPPPGANWPHPSMRAPASADAA